MTIWSSSGDSGGQASGSDPVVEFEAKKAFGGGGGFVEVARSVDRAEMTERD